MKKHSRPNSLEKIDDPLSDCPVTNGHTNNMATEKRNSFDSVKEYFTDYTTNSNLHGLKYIGEKQRTLLEKLFWVLMFTSCVLVCGYTIMKQCNKWPENPIIVSFAERPTPVWQLSPDINEIFSGCMWKDAISNCSDMFYEVITEEGFCYTFNSLGANELLRLKNLHKDYNYMALDHKNISWTLDGGYPPNSPLDSYPWRGSPYGTNAYLTFSLMANVSDLDYACSGPVQGFKILLHNPAELPRLSEQFFRAPLSKEVIVAVKPKMMTTSEGLRSYDPERRQCYLQNERYLNYFKIYTQSNCEMECLTNFTYARCGCVHFGMPLELVTIEMKSAMAADDENDTIIGEAREVALRCKCLPACTSIDYEAEISQADYDLKSVLRALALSREYEKEGMLLGQVFVFFKEAQFIASRRSELFGPYDFLANCGGLLGLFMGFSILSVVEIIYFLTLRLYYLLRKKKDLKINADLNTNRLA
ncbi:pickpocket protein 28-like [Pieris napi]|uniref:pickpocket protein 28-like n=1 Tax=Pieris napi TaxID=78633 RepID=UPI001FBAB9D1|nr:pickpocket protein 28-like [Pieris napi]